MTIFFTADTHFGHNNIIKYTHRPFNSVDEMDEYIIDAWNNVVKNTDSVYHLGDFTLGNKKMFDKYIRRLKGKIFIVSGGHDKGWKKGNSGDIILLPELTNINIDDTSVVLCHYPLLTWEKSYYGSIHFHGHSHGTIGKMGFAGDVSSLSRNKSAVRVDVGTDCWNFTPIKFETLREEIIKFKERYENS